MEAQCVCVPEPVEWLMCPSCLVPGTEVGPCSMVGILSARPPLAAISAAFAGRVCWDLFVNILRSTSNRAVILLLSPSEDFSQQDW